RASPVHHERQPFTPRRNRREMPPMTRSGDKPRSPTSVGALLNESGRLRPRADRIDRDRWRSLLGERIGERTRPGRVQHGRLPVYVASAVWARELSLLSSTILERLVNAGLRGEELFFRGGDIAEPDEPKMKKAAPEPAEPPRAALPSA